MQLALYRTLELLGLGVFTARHPASRVGHDTFTFPFQQLLLMVSVSSRHDDLFCGVDIGPKPLEKMV